MGWNPNWWAQTLQTELDEQEPTRVIDCECTWRRDYDGEKIHTHCDRHCPKVQNGQWDHCKGC